MSNPTSREEMKQWCLRRLGHPVIKINIDDDQMEDRIDEGLQYFADYHYSGSVKEYYKHQVNPTDVTNKYITVPEFVSGVVRVFPVGDPISTGSDIFNLQYQIALNDLYTLTSVSMIPYFMTMQHIGLIQELLVGQHPIRYNRHENRVYLDMDWSKIHVGRYLIFELYRIIDPDVYADIWNDRWLKQYVTVLFKEQWGENLSKFGGVQIAGGVTLNGDRILEQARADKEKMETEMITKYSPPVYDMMG